MKTNMTHKDKKLEGASGGSVCSSLIFRFFKIELILESDVYLDVSRAC